MPTLSANLELGRCPHCSIAHPNLSRKHHFETTDHTSHNRRFWAVYACSRCGGIVTASAQHLEKPVSEYFPRSQTIDEAIPPRPGGYLKEALECLHAPAAATMAAASAVDAMLKERGFADGKKSLKARIDDAAKAHAITAEMAQWAHDVRLDANDQRHVDDDAPMPSSEDAQRVVDFALAIAEFMFVLPKRVQRGLAEAEASGKDSPS